MKKNDNKSRPGYKNKNSEHTLSNRIRTPGWSWALTAALCNTLLWSENLPAVETRLETDPVQTEKQKTDSEAKEKKSNPELALLAKSKSVRKPAISEKAVDEKTGDSALEGKDKFKNPRDLLNKRYVRDDEDRPDDQGLGP